MMCAIIGTVAWACLSRKTYALNKELNHIFEASLERGRDGRGWYANYHSYKGGVQQSIFKSSERNDVWGQAVNFFEEPVKAGTLIGNLRAEPTTEYVEEKTNEDQQPYADGPWKIVHNGTIANDADLRTHCIDTKIDSAAIAELLGQDDMDGCDENEIAEYFATCVDQLEGSYAILATHDEFPEMLMIACNYRPIWYTRSENKMLFASARQYLPQQYRPLMLPAYSTWVATPGHIRQLRAQPAQGRRALVVCSGGLDSVTAAAKAKYDGYQIELLHFQYGSRAQDPEIKAVKACAEALGVPVRYFVIPLYKPEDSPLLQSDSEIAGGEEGAEFAHEWVPARNLVMLSIATALAEANGFDTIVLGNNLEEAGAYPDNEPEFISRFNDMLPFAVADGKRIRVEMPVGNMMKHEIVELGSSLGAPLDKTWSCYRAGEKHCGTCGPCFMRRTAFKINGLPEVIKYANEEN